VREFNYSQREEETLDTQRDYKSSHHMAANILFFG